MLFADPFVCFEAQIWKCSGKLMLIFKVFLFRFSIYTYDKCMIDSKIRYALLIFY
jgi:hypothetical protein